MAEEITGYRLEYMHGGTTVEGYMARPEGAGPWPGVVVIQEWWGLEPHIEDICRRFAKEGFAAIAPDLYHGALTDDPNEAGRLMRQMNMEEAVREIISGAQYLKRQPYCNSLVGVVGFCLGGGLSLLTALRKSGASACVVYYGGNPDPVEQVKNLECPLLGLYGEEDTGVPPSTVRALEAKLKEYGKEHEVHMYPGAPHAFFCENRESYRKEAAEDSWRRTIAFFRDKLK